MRYPCTNSSIVLLRGPEDDTASEAIMRFRLTYAGELRPTQRDPIGDQSDPLATHKHRVRKVFHQQLKRLWGTDKFLKESKILQYPGGGLEQAHPDSDLPPMSEVLANLYREFGYRFVPLVREDFHLLCSLRILFLRRDGRGSVIQAGDIDNRIKTIIDALRRPRSASELVGHESPADGEDPFFVLLEDDNQVSHLEVETDVLLEPLTPADADQRKVNLFVTVEIRPYVVTKLNSGFA